MRVQLALQVVCTWFRFVNHWLGYMDRISSRVARLLLLLLQSFCSSCSSSSNLSSFLCVLLPCETLIKGDAGIGTPPPPQLGDKVTRTGEAKASWATTLDPWSQGRRQSNMLSVENQHRQPSSELSPCQQRCWCSTYFHGCGSQDVTQTTKPISQMNGESQCQVQTLAQ